MAFPPDVFNSAFYQAPPNQPPQVLPGFFSAFLATRLPWSNTVFEARLRALDPSARQGYISGLVEQRTRLADAYRQAAADIDRRVSEGADRDVELRKVEASLLNSAVSAQADIFGARAGVREAEIRSSELSGDALNVRNRFVEASATLEANVRRFADANGRLPTAQELQGQSDLLPAFQNLLQTQANAMGQMRLTDGQRVAIARDAEDQANQVLGAIDPALGALGVSMLRRTAGTAPTRTAQEGIGGVNLGPLRRAAEDARATRIGEAGPRGTLTAGGGASSDARTLAAAGTPRQQTPELQELRRQIRAVDALIDAAKTETLEEAFGLLGGFGEPLPGFGRARRPSRQRPPSTGRGPTSAPPARDQEPPPQFPVQRAGGFTPVQRDRGTGGPLGPIAPPGSGAPTGAATRRSPGETPGPTRDRQAEFLRQAREAAAEALESPRSLRLGRLAAEVAASQPAPRPAPAFQGPTLAQREAPTPEERQARQRGAVRALGPARRQEAPVQPRPRRGEQFVRGELPRPRIGPTLEQREAPTPEEIRLGRRAGALTPAPAVNTELGATAGEIALAEQERQRQLQLLLEEEERRRREQLSGAPGPVGQRVP